MPKEHTDIAFSIALFDKPVSLLSSDHDLQSAQAGYGPGLLGRPRFPIPRFGVGSSLMLSTLGSMVSMASTMGTLRREREVENRSSCPPSQKPANRSYKYGLAWPGLAL